MPDIYEQLILHEGLKLKPYRCTAGKLTIGVGRNLEDKGISRDEALMMLKNDVEEVEKALSTYTWFKNLDGIRQKVLIDMAFNLGVGGLMQFKKMIAAIEKSNYESAASEMMNSKWAKQVGKRSDRLATMMRTGSDYTV